MNLDPETASTVSELAKILGGGGLLAFAFAVWQEMRFQRLERKASEERMFSIVEDNTAAFREVTSQLATILEHTRIQSNPTRMPTGGKT